MSALSPAVCCIPVPSDGVKKSRMCRRHAALRLIEFISILHIAHSLPSYQGPLCPCSLQILSSLQIRYL